MMQNLRYNYRGTIDADIYLGADLVPTTIDSSDDIYAQAMAGEFGPIAEYVAPAPDISFTYGSKIRDINTWLAAQLKPISNRYPAEERDTWEIQRAEAERYNADNQAQTPFLDALAAARGAPKAELAQSILTNAQAFISASAAAMGQAQILRAQADAALAAEDIEAINAVEVPSA